jgi:hypothetical protein
MPGKIAQFHGCRFPRAIATFNTRIAFLEGPKTSEEHSSAR